MPARVSEKGIALIFVLWAVILLSIIAVTFLDETKSDSLMTRNLLERAQAKSIADGEVYRAIDLLLKSQFNADAVFDGRPATSTDGDAHIDVRIQDESGKVDLNSSPNALLEAVFKSAGVQQPAAAAFADIIADWRDRDDLRRVRGAERQDYEHAGYSYGPKNAPFGSVDELRLVLGMTPEIYGHVVGSLTVYSGLRGVDIRVAPASVLAAIGSTDSDTRKNEAVGAFIESRDADDPGLLDDALRELSIPRHFVARSRRSSFSIRIEVRLPAGLTLVRTAVVRIRPRAEPAYEVLFWR